MNENYEWPVASTKALLLPAVVSEKASPLDLCISQLGPNLLTPVAGILLYKKTSGPDLRRSKHSSKKGICTYAEKTWQG